MKRAFTLLEIVIGIALLALISSAIVWKMSRLIDRKRFDSSVERIQSRIFTCRRLAMNMQADWSAVLEKRENHWAFTAICSENPGSFGLPVAHLGSLKILFNGQERDSISFEFSGTGEISPKGFFQIIDDHTGQKREWKIPDIFFSDQSQKQGPLHPEEIF